MSASAKRSCIHFIFAVVLACASASAFAQTPDVTPTASALPLPSTPAKTASPTVDLVTDASGGVPPQQVRALLQQAEERDIENDKRQRDYTYVERQEEHKLDGDGAVKKTEVRTSEILEVYGEPVERLIAKDDKPLSAEDAKKEEEKIQKIIDKRKNESEEVRRKRLDKEEKAREEDHKFVLEVADAFNFRLIGSEVMDGRDTWVLEGDPRTDYEPKHREAKILTKFKGRVWIDKADVQWVKLDLTAIDTISFGLVLARIHKGARVVIDLTRVNDEVWLPKSVEFRLDARVALLKNYREDIEQTFWDYKKFRTHSKITVIGETQ